MADIGGTHARFAVAQIAGGKDISLERRTTLKTNDYLSLRDAWAAYAASLGPDCPREAAIAVAASVKEEPVSFTNAPWTLEKSTLERELLLDRHLLINDFVAVGHAVARLEDDAFDPVCGPQKAREGIGNISVVGPGTGLGVAQLAKIGENIRVIETEGGHIGFAPTDEFEDRLLRHLRQQYGRVSVERVISGPGLRAIFEMVAIGSDVREIPADDRALWQLALSGEQAHAAEAIERFCGILGSVAGDIALAQGADMLIVAGGLGQRLAGHIKASGFAERFCAKGRFQGLMEQISVKQLTHPEPGLYGAAAAFLAVRGDDDE